MEGIPRVYVAATRQNEGKTTTALGLLAVTSELFERVGYIKPVGQQVKLIGSSYIDKDACLMRDVFNIGTDLEDMSPLAVPSGFTEEFIREGDVRNLRGRIQTAYDKASAGRDFMLIEGTGHAGVGSVFDLSNAAVAAMLKAPVVIVTSGGIGKPIDEVMLNLALFQAHGAKVVGVVVNKVMPDKYDKVSTYVRMGFEKKGLPVLGVIPYFPDLSSPTLRQLHEDLRGELISGEDGLDRAVEKVIVGAMPAHSIFEYFKGGVLLVTPGNREDLILAALTCGLPNLQQDYSVRGMILTCGEWPNGTVLSLLKQANVPAILVKDDTFIVAQKIHSLSIKIRAGDDDKIAIVRGMVRKYVDVESLVARIKSA
jgi:BioD-like phosphotransacetylase family protein